MSTTDRPLISVVMGVWNDAAELPATIESILAQEGVDLELIVVDDGSTDGTQELLKARAALDPRLRVLRQNHAGLTEALRLGCSKARGGFIARQDAGDVSFPGRLRRQRDLLQEQSDVILAGCGYQVVAPGGEVLGETRGEDATTAKERFDRLDSGTLTLLHHGTAMFRRTAYERCGGYRAQFHYAQDHDLWTRFLEQGGIAYVQEVLYQVKFSLGSISVRAKPEQRRLGALAVAAARARRAGESEAPILDEAATIRLPPGGKGRGRTGRAAYFVGSVLLKRGNPAARKYLKEAIRLAPLNLKAYVRLLQSWLPKPR